MAKVWKVDNTGKLVQGKEGTAGLQSGGLFEWDATNGHDHSGTQKGKFVDHANLLNKGTNTHATIDAQLPSASEKLALAGTNGTPSGTNKYVTNTDPRLTTPSGNIESMATAETGTTKFLQPNGSGGVQWQTALVPTHGSTSHDTTVEATANKNVANGYAPLDASIRLPRANMPYGYSANRIVKVWDNHIPLYNQILSSLGVRPSSFFTEFLGNNVYQVVSDEFIWYNEHSALDGTTRTYKLYTFITTTNSVGATYTCDAYLQFWNGSVWVQQGSIGSVAGVNYNTASLRYWQRISVDLGTMTNGGKYRLVARSNCGQTSGGGFIHGAKIVAIDTSA